MRGDKVQGLVERFASLAAGIVATEEAFAAGRREVDHTEGEIRARYERRFAEPRPAAVFRLPAIIALLERAKRLIAPTRLVVDARSTITASETGDKEHLTVELDVAGETLRWSHADVFNVRFWGIEIRPTDERARERIDQDTWKRVIRNLDSDLSSLSEIEASFADRPEAVDLCVVSGDEGEAFERLMVDILNEGSLRARQATLDEDFLEKTDLRVRLPGLARRRGARVQVAMTKDGNRARDKRAEIKHAEEFVLLSPWTIAEALATPTDEAWLSTNLARDVHTELGTANATVHVIAERIRSVLDQALREQGQDARGPSRRVPQPLRRLIQGFVEREARSGTQALRAREGRRHPGKGL